MKHRGSLRRLISVPKIILCCLLLVCMVLLSSPTVSARSFSNTIATITNPELPANPHAGPTFTVTAGFDTRYRDGTWVPIHINLRNDDTDFTGKITVHIPRPFAGATNEESSTVYQELINLPTGSQKLVTIYVPIYYGTPVSLRALRVELIDKNGQKIAGQKATLRTLATSDVFVGILSEQPTTGFSALNSIKLPSPFANLITQQLTADSMPTVAAALKNFDLIVLDNFTTSTLSKDQLAALSSWVNQGGSLIVAGGPEWRNTLSPLPQGLLPVTVSGTTTLAANTDLIPVGGPGTSGPQQGKPIEAVKAPIIVSTSQATKDATIILAAGETPLLVQAKRGKGIVCYLAFDPTLEPVTRWPGASLIWEGLLLRTLGQKVIAPDLNANMMVDKLYYNAGGMEGLLRLFFPNAFPSTWLVLALLLGYILMLGPLRLLIVRWTKKRDWSWRIALSTILVFSVLSYGLAVLQKGTSILSSSISVMRLDKALASETPAHLTTYVGVYVPNQGDFHVHIPGNSLAHPYLREGDFVQQGGMRQTLITNTQNGVDVNLQGVDTWVLRSVIAQRDTQVNGKIISDLTVKDGTLMGTITNNLPYTLEDVYIFINGDYVPLGRVEAGKQVPVSLQLTTTPATVPLADRVATDNGLPTPYGPYYADVKIENPKFRHIATMSTLSSDGMYYDYGFASSFMPTKGMALAGGGPYGPYQFGFTDPLLLQGAPATLLGWINNADIPGKVTINNDHTAQTLETVVQAPLDVSFTGNVSLSSTLMQGQMVAVETTGKNVQTSAFDVYALPPGGHMTFEFLVPDITGFKGQALTVQEPANLTQMVSLTGAGAGQGVGTPLDVSALDINLYNWETKTWDSYSMSSTNTTFMTTAAASYIGPSGRILIQFAHEQSTQQSPAMFSKPFLELQGSTSSSSQQ